MSSQFVIICFTVNNHETFIDYIIFCTIQTELLIKLDKIFFKNASIFMHKDFMYNYAMSFSAFNT